MASLDLKEITKIYDNSVTAVKNFSLGIEDKEFIIFVGPSGCGKSTALRMIAGLEEITAGELFIGGKKMNDVPASERDIAMVFQNYSLYPHMTVYDNIAFGLAVRKVPKPEIRQKVLEVSRILDLEDLLERKPKALSGGQKQRVAMGRAIVREPKVFLMDEPLSNLDAKLRVQMRLEIAKLHRRLQTTFIYVTHDQIEAMTLGDRIVVMKDGEIMQTDTPDNLYNRPANLFVAGFIGTPAMNFVDSGLFPELGLQDAILGVRAEDVYIGKGGLPATVESKEMHGADSFVNLSCQDQTLVARIDSAGAKDLPEQALISVNPARIHLFDKTSGERIQPDISANSIADMAFR